jgi:hypothetical protein
MKIWAKTDQYSEGKYLVVRRDGTIPEWPHFVIGGFDPCGPPALRAYAEAARTQGFDQAYCESIEELASDFEALAATERARKVADPTAGPHRKDSPFIVQLMGGERDAAHVHLRRELAGQRPDDETR